jgi:hypothetical protein
MGHPRAVTSTFYAIPSHLPVVWTGPASIQVGISPPLASVTDIPDDATALIHALTSGISEGGLAMLATQHRISPRWVTALLDQLGPVFSQDPPADPPPSWQVWSSSSAGVDIHRLGVAMGLPLVTCDPPSDDLPATEPTILIADYVLHPHWVNTLTREGHPHLPVVFFDQEVSVGPIITPGVTPCLVCLESHRRQATASWLEVGSQLWGRESPLHTPAVHGTVLALILGFLTGHLGWDTANTSRQALFRPREATTTWRDVSFHPGCACRGVSEWRT